MTPHIRIVPHLESTRSLVFGVIERDVPDNTLLKIGRFTDKIFLPNRITFKSKVVSRGHAEIWTEQGKVSKSDFLPFEKDLPSDVTNPVFFS